MLDLFEWFDLRRPTGVLIVLLPAITGWTMLYWLADMLLPLIGAWTHVVVPVGIVSMLAVIVRMREKSRGS